MAKEAFGGERYDPKSTWALHAWEAVNGRPVNPDLVKMINGEPFAPAPILRGSHSIVLNESIPQSNTPTPNP